MLGAIALWSGSPVTVKLALVWLSAPEIASLRIFGGLVILWGVGLSLRYNFRLSQVGPLPLLMGFLEPGLVTTLMMFGLVYTSPANASVVWALLPLMQPILGYLVLKERLERAVLVGAAFVLVGAAILFATKHQDGSGNLFGDMLLVLAVLSAGANQLLARRIATTRRLPMVTTAYQMITASLLTIAVMLFVVPIGESFQDVGRINWFVLAFLIVSAVGPFLLYNFALQHMAVGRVSLFGPLSGPIGIILASLVFDEPIYASTILAVFLVLLGAFMPGLHTWFRQRRLM